MIMWKKLKKLLVLTLILSAYVGCDRDLYEQSDGLIHQNFQYSTALITQLYKNESFSVAISKLYKINLNHESKVNFENNDYNPYGFKIVDAPVHIISENGTEYYTLLIEKLLPDKNKLSNLLIEINNDQSKLTIIDYNKITYNTGIEQILYSEVQMEEIAFDTTQTVSSKFRSDCIDIVILKCILNEGAQGYCGGSEAGCQTHLRICPKPGADDSSAIGSNLPPITVPNTGANGGSVGAGTTKPPCKQLQDALNKPVVNSVTPSTVKDAMNDLINQMPTNPRERSYEMNPTVPDESSFGATLTEGEINGDGIENYNPGTNVVSILLHCHYKFSQYSVFSLADLQNIFAMIATENITSPETFTSILVTIHGSKYALKIAPAQENLILNNQNFFAGWEFDNIRDLREKTYEKSVKSTFTKEKQEIGLLQFIKKQNLGLELYKADNNLNWSKLTLSITGQDVKVTPCP